MRGFRVRLACVRHAASVDSEPGSNSQVKGVASVARSERLTREACLKWLHLRCSVRQVKRWFAARLRTRTDGPATTCAAPPADTRRVVLARSIQFSKNRNCSSPSHLIRFWGNLPILLTRYAFVNPPLAPFVLNRRRALLPGGLVEPRRALPWSVRRTAPNPPRIRSRRS